jgi:hypothetical protein
MDDPAAWVIARPIADVPLLCEDLRVLIGSTAAAVIVCDVASLPADAHTLDALARLALTARRLDRRLSLAGASADLLALLSFAGLAGVLGRATRPDPA